MKQLRKSNKKVIAGVCGGIAECFKIDPTIVRLCVCILALLTRGLMLVLYIVAAIIMPSADSVEDYSDDNVDNMKSANINPEDKGNSESEKNSSSGAKSAPHTTEEFNSFFENK